MVAGINPGGGVSVWVSGIDKTTEIFRGQAEKVDLDWRNFYDKKSFDHDSMVQSSIKRVVPEEVLEEIQKNGIPFDLWDKYRTQYDWQPVFTGITLRDDLIYPIYYFNGEEDYLFYPLEPELAEATRPVPKELHFIWAFSEQKGRIIELYFNEEEIFSAFEKLSEDGRRLELEMRMFKSEEGQNRFSVLLKNGEEEIYLKRTNLETYAAKTLE